MARQWAMVDGTVRKSEAWFVAWVSGIIAALATGLLAAFLSPVMPDGSLTEKVVRALVIALLMGWIPGTAVGLIAYQITVRAETAQHRNENLQMTVDRLVKDSNDQHHRIWRLENPNASLDEQADALLNDEDE